MTTTLDNFEYSSPSALSRRAPSSVVPRLHRRRARFITVRRVRPIAQKAVDSFSYGPNKLKIRHVGPPIAAPAIDTVTAVKFSENRPRQRLAIDEGLAMRTLQPGQRLLLFWVHMIFRHRLPPHVLAIRFQRNYA